MWFTFYINEKSSVKVQVLKHKAVTVIQICTVIDLKFVQRNVAYSSS
jgi:hypothetical protein